MSKYLMLTLPLMVTVTWAFSQSPVKQTVVLNDGSRITGTIISDTSGYFTIIVTEPSIVIINKERVVSAGKPGKSEIPVTDCQGFNIKFSTGVLLGNSEYGRVNSLSFHVATGCQLGRGLNAGAGSGIEDVNVTLIPVFAEFSYNLLKTKLSPYAWLKIGYAFPVSDYRSDRLYYDGYGPGKTYGGFLISTGIGTSFRLQGGNAVIIGAGYRTQRVRVLQKTPYFSDSGVRETVTDFRRFEIQVGFIFR